MQPKLIAGFLLVLIAAFFFFSRLPVEVVREEAQRRIAQEKLQRELRAPLPDFSTLPSGHARKEAFFEFLLPLVQHANGELLKARDRIESLRRRLDDGPLTMEETLWLGLLADHYRVSAAEGFNHTFFERLLRRVDIIPPSLVLAQAAKESGWGTSRFAREGNNLFGEWCYTKGCGLVPTRRAQGAQHEVARFESPYDSLLSYMHNLNRHESYLTLRKYREQAREENGIVSGQLLAEGLSRYSERGHAYVQEIKSMIRHNELARFDDVLVASAESGK